MGPIIEMVIYSLIPFIFLPVVFGIWFLKQNKVEDKKNDKSQEYESK